MADKRRARYGAKGGNLTPQQAKKQLTVPLYAVMTGQAHAEFRHGNLASPGSLVVIVPNDSGCSRLLNGRGYGSVCVNGRQWQKAVVPLLQSSTWNPTSGNFQFVAQNANWTYLLETLGNAIAQSFSDAGYGPVDK